jgi:heme exporter protein C
MGRAMNISTAAVPDHARGTGTRATRLLGIAALVALAWQTLFALVFSPDDFQQGTAVRFLYLHVPAVICAYLGFGLCALGGVQYLRNKTLGWDRFAGACGEMGLVFMAITILSGALWGKRTWGAYWAWDARLTTSALLFLLFLGYVAVRGLEAAPAVRARRAAYVGIFAAANIPIVNRSVTWWRSLHQGSTLSRPDVEIDGLMLFSLFVSIVAFLLLFVWLVIHRYRALVLEELADTRGLDAAIDERAREGVDVR